MLQYWHYYSSGSKDIGTGETAKTKPEGVCVKLFVGRPRKSKKISLL